MTAKELVLELVKRQSKKAVLDECWDKLEPDIEVDKYGRTDICFPSVAIGFAFDKQGRFLGIFNWRE